MATSSLGRLTLDLAVRLSEFTDGMSRAERETANRTQRMQESVTSFREHLASELGGTQLGGIIDTFNERFGSLEGSITKVGAAFAGIAVGGIAVGLGALSKMAIETANADAQMAQFANRANVGVESFQVLSEAAKGLGYEQEQLADIFADMQEKLGEFSMTEGGGAADFFEALKNNTEMTDDQIRQLGKTLQGKDGIQAVQLLKDKMDELGATSQEQRFVFESLASDLTNLLPLFEDGGDLLAAYDEELRQAGIITSKEAIEQSRLLAAQTQSVQQRFSVFGSELGRVMIPILGTLLQHFMAGGKQGSAFGTIVQGIGVIAKGVAAVILTFSTAIGMFGSTVGMVMAQLANLGEMYVAFNNADGLVAKGQALAAGFGRASSMGKDWWDGLVSDAKRADGTMQALVNGQSGRLDNLSQINYLLSQQQKDYSKGIKINTVQAEENAKALEKQTAAREKNTKSINAQATATARLVGISGNSGIGSGAHLDIRASGGGRRLTASELARFQADGKPLTAYRKTSDYGYRGNIGVNGASKYHRGIDFAMPVGTPITTKVPVKNVSNFYDSKGGGYVQRIVFEDGLSVDLLHQSPASKGIKGGSSTTKTTPYSSAKSESYSLIAKSNEDAKREAEQREKERQRQLEQDARDRQSLAEKYYTEEQRINAENEKNMAEINRLYVRGTKEYHDALVLENERYLKAYSEYEWKLGEKARAQLALIDKIKDDIGSSVMQSTNDYLDATMKSSLNPEQYAKWSMQRDYNNQYSSLYGQYENRQNEINAKDDQGNFRIDSETERNALLEQAREEHLAKLYTLESEHVAKVKELDKQVNDAKAQQTSAAFGVMTSAMSTFFGQQSISYKMAANAEKGYALYQAWLNSKKAVLAAYADTPGSIWAKMGAAGKAAIDTGLMTAAIQAISPRGFSSGGYTGNYGVNDVAGVVHGQEYVLNAMATKRIGVDNLNSLNSGASIGNNNVSVNVVVNSDGSSSVESSAQMGKQMGDAIKVAVQQEVYKMMRQGGPLYGR